MNTLRLLASLPCHQCCGRLFRHDALPISAANTRKIDKRMILTSTYVINASHLCYKVSLPTFKDRDSGACSDQTRRSLAEIHNQSKVSSSHLIHILQERANSPYLLCGLWTYSYSLTSLSYSFCTRHGDLHNRHAPINSSSGSLERHRRRQGSNTSDDRGNIWHEVSLHSRVRR